jgi:hypothetical protein
LSPLVLVFFTFFSVCCSPLSVDVLCLLCCVVLCCVVFHISCPVVLYVSCLGGSVY